MMQLRSARSFMSIVRGQVMRRGSMFERVALLQMIVEHRREQRMRARDRVKVAGEMQVDVVHRHHLRVPAARRAALHAEHRPEARLANAERDLLAHSPQRLRESDGDRALPFSGRRRVRRRDDDEPAANRPLRDVERNLRLVLAVQIELVALDTQLGGDVLDRTHLDGLCDFDVGGNGGNAHGCRSWSMVRRSACSQYTLARPVPRTRPDERDARRLGEADRQAGRARDGGEQLARRRSPSSAPSRSSRGS